MRGRRGSLCGAGRRGRPASPHGIVSPFSAGVGLVTLLGLLGACRAGGARRGNKRGVTPSASRGWVGGFNHHICVFCCVVHVLGARLVAASTHMRAQSTVHAHGEAVWHSAEPARRRAELCRHQTDASRPGRLQTHGANTHAHARARRRWPRCEDTRYDEVNENDEGARRNAWPGLTPGPALLSGWPRARRRPRSS